MLTKMVDHDTMPKSSENLKIMCATSMPSGYCDALFPGTLSSCCWRMPMPASRKSVNGGAVYIISSDDGFVFLDGVRDEEV